MSHVSAIETVINDLDALEEAAQTLGLELIRGQKTFRWYGQWVKDYHGDDAAYKHGVDPSTYGKCDHVLRIPGSDENTYEIGLVQQPDSTFKIVLDHWGPGQKLVEKIGGLEGKLLNHAYVQAKTVKELTKKGFKLIKQENLASGKTKLTLQGPIKL